MTDRQLDRAPTVFEGQRFRVVAMELTCRQGGTGCREVVMPANAVVIVPMLDPETVVMIRNKRFAIGQTLWELPAGTLESGEAPQDGAARELLEETGYEATELTPLIEFYPSPGFCTELMTMFRATGLTFHGQNLDDTEQLTVELVPLDDAVQMVRDNRVRDGKTIAAMLYHMRFPDH